MAAVVTTATMARRRSSSLDLSVMGACIRKASFVWVEMMLFGTSNNRSKSLGSIPPNTMYVIPSNGGTAQLVQRRNESLAKDSNQDDGQGTLIGAS